MMVKELPHIVVVGSPPAFNPIFDELEETRRYHFDYIVNAKTLPIFLRGKPNAVLLHVPEEREAAEQALLWLETLKGQVPVVVLSTAADTNLYLAAMTCGAFDYITSYTPVSEITRVLDKALRWYKEKVAA